MQERPEEPSGDYEYDLVHEQIGGRHAGGQQSPPGRPGPAPARHAAELDQDMSYDEAHDF